MTILLLNAGSSSLKATVMGNESESLFLVHADWAGDVTRYQSAGPEGRTPPIEVDWKGHAKAVARLIADLPPEMRSSLAAVGHRVVHGGPFTSSVRITPEVRARIETLVSLAPLHNPPSLEALSAAEEALPNVPHVAVFDTSFHATLPPEAHTYPVPATWTQQWGIRRYGFHGLSHAYCARRAAEMLGPHNGLKLVICHLGHGCSASAVRGGRCVDTTMGFTPLDGLMMATRSGAVDPSIVFHVQQKHGLTPSQVETALNRESGLLGVSGVSADMRDVIAAAKRGHGQAKLALEIFTHRVRHAIGGLTATLGGIDALIFTAGIGEHSADIRAAICDHLGCLGLKLDVPSNARCQPDMDIAQSDSSGRILVIATREDVTMIREIKNVLSI